MNAAVKCEKKEEDGEPMEPVFEGECRILNFLF